MGKHGKRYTTEERQDLASKFMQRVYEGLTKKEASEKTGISLETLAQYVAEYFPHDYEKIFPERPVKRKFTRPAEERGQMDLPSVAPSKEKKQRKAYTFKTRKPKETPQMITIPLAESPPKPLPPSKKVTALVFSGDASTVGQMLKQAMEGLAG